jgi:hypothetical protein
MIKEINIEEVVGENVIIFYNNDEFLEFNKEFPFIKLPIDFSFPIVCYNGLNEVCFSSIHPENIIDLKKEEFNIKTVIDFNDFKNFIKF